MDKEEYLTFAEVAQRVHVHYETVRRWARDGVIPTVRIGTVRRIRKSDLERIVTPVSSDMDREGSKA